MLLPLPANRSQTFSHLGYDPLTQRLQLRFKSGGAYEYRNVTPLMHAQLQNAPSLGSWFNKNLWGKPKEHPSRIIEPIPPKPIR